jgi:hypothetical protein
MNKAITDGLVFAPPAFSAGLGVWSSENGTAGSATYNGAGNASIVTGDSDFGSCLELVKLNTTTKLRSMGQTQLFPGCYLQVRARIKAMSGNLPSVRIAGYAMNGSNVHVTGLVETGPTTTLTAYGDVVEVSAIVGTGSKGGVNMAWGMTPVYGHFGLDLTGSNGGIVRIESIEIEDISDAYLRDMLGIVDVRDYGAVGNGVTDDRAAFVAADADAKGRQILVPSGTYYIGSSISISAPVKFEGTLVMAAASRLALLSNFDFPTYAEAFGDEQLGLMKALQSLMSYTDHTVLDLCGRRVEINKPLRVAEYAPGLTTWSNRRVLTNGQLNAVAGTEWGTVALTSQGTYNTNSPFALTAVANIANIKVGSRITGTGVGREIYVKAVNVASSSLTLSAPMFGGSATRNFTFTRDQYLLDFSGMEQLDRFYIDQVEMLCNTLCSGVLLAPEGEMFHMHDCMMVRPKDRAITSPGNGCQDMVVDRCEFLSPDMEKTVSQRTSIAINANKNDLKIRNNRFVMFKHTMVLGGAGNVIVGNHWFQGDYETDGIRTAGLILAQTSAKTAVTGNYIDNCSIEWTNEYEVFPDFGVQYTFSGLTITGNIFTAIDVAPWFTWITIKPYGAGHYLFGLNVSCNSFRTLAGAIDRVEKVDTTYAPLDNLSNRNIYFDGNTFTGVTNQTSNPVFFEHNQATAQTVWTVDPSTYLPFGGQARHVESLVFRNMITNAAGGRVTEMPYVSTDQGTKLDKVTINWSQAAKGRAMVKIRMDNPN